MYSILWIYWTVGIQKIRENSKIIGRNNTFSEYYREFNPKCDEIMKLSIFVEEMYKIRNYKSSFRELILFQKSFRLTFVFLVYSNLFFWDLRSMCKFILYKTVFNVAFQVSINGNGNLRVYVFLHRKSVKRKVTLKWTELNVGLFQNNETYFGMKLNLFIAKICLWYIAHSAFHYY